MENIFENAKFGDKFRTRDGRMAIFCGKLPAINLYRIVIEGNLNSSNYSEFGMLNPHAESLYDIIGKWEEHKKESSINYTTSEIVHNILRDVLHFEQHHEKSEGITQYIRNKYGKYI